MTDAPSSSDTPTKKKPDNNEKKVMTCPGKGCGKKLSDSIRIKQLERINKAKKQGRKTSMALCDQCFTKLKSTGSLEYENGQTREWVHKAVAANVAEVTEKDAPPVTDENTQSNVQFSGFEASMKKMMDDQLSKFTSEFAMGITTAMDMEPEPEPEGGEPSVSELIAKAIIANRK